LFLVPERNLGVFVSTNLAYSPRFFRTFRRLFFDRYLPGPSKGEPEQTGDITAELDRYAGSYMSVRRVRNSILTVGGFTSVIKVKPTADGYLMVHYPGGRIPPRRLAMVEPGLFRDVDTDSMVAARETDQGTVTHILLGGGALEKLSWYAEPGLHAVVFACATALFLLTVGGWILGSLSRRLAMGPPSPVRRGVRVTAGAMCMLQAVFLAWGFTALNNADVYALMEKIPTSFTVMFLLPLAGAVLTAVMIIRLFAGFRTEVNAPLATLHYVVLTAAAIIVLLVQWHWSLLGFWY
jgi:hypothetical protein